jgi:hypothetical protein
VAKQENKTPRREDENVGAMEERIDQALENVDDEEIDERMDEALEHAGESDPDEVLHDLEEGHPDEEQTSERGSAGRKGAANPAKGTKQK